LKTTDNNPKIGLICVSLAGERTDLAEQFLTKARDNLQKSEICILNSQSGVVLDARQVMTEAEEALQKGADCIVYIIGTWVLAKYVVDPILRLGIPTAIWGVPEGASFSSVGANVVHGTLDDMNIAHRLFYGDPNDNETICEIVAYCKATMIRSSLTYATMGLIGGRSISAYPTVADPNQIKKTFGLEIEHIDQSLLLEYACTVPDYDVQDIIRELPKRYGKITADPKFVERSVRVYLALRKIVRENSLDLIAVKCLDEFINLYTSCCLAVSMLNDEGIPTVCQSDINAAISFYILSLLSEDPPYFGDIGYVDKKNAVVHLINCGSLPARLASSGDDVELNNQYEYMGKGRGVCTFFCCKPGPVTFGTLGRINGEYVMHIATGNAFSEPIEKLIPVRTWAQGFVKLDGNPAEFFYNLRSNHSVAGYGIFDAELNELCRLLNIRTV